MVVHTKDDTIKRDIRDVSWQVGFDHELVISTVTYSTEQFEHGPLLAKFVSPSHFTPGSASMTEELQALISYRLEQADEVAAETDE